MILPAGLRERLELELDSRILSATRVDGGMINETARVETTDGPVFLKWIADPPMGFYSAESFGLAKIGSSQTLRTPRVIAILDQAPAGWGGAPAGCPPFLALEWIEESVATNSAAFARRFGEGLATLHQKVTCHVFGLGHQNFIGVLDQENGRRKRWVDFYRECRILPQMEIARKLGRLPTYRERLLNQLLERVEDLLAGLDSTPSLLHGDLWSGNYLCAGEEPVVIDPAVYYGEREMEIAYMQLFGGFDRALFDAYEEVYPLQPGYERRRALHQLYALLVHLNHFGEKYGPDVDRVCRQYL